MKETCELCGNYGKTNQYNINGFSCILSKMEICDECHEKAKSDEEIIKNHFSKLKTV